MKVYEKSEAEATKGAEGNAGTEGNTRAEGNAETEGNARAEGNAREVTNIIVERFVLGSVQTNCYVVASETTSTCVVIDPAESDRVYEFVKGKGYKVAAILLTHGHGDHISGVKRLKEQTMAPVYIHEEDFEMAQDSYLNVADWLGMKGLTVVADRTFKGRDELKFDGLSFSVIHTPGHTPGSSCFKLKGHKLLFSGDTMFAGNCGRCDLPGGNSAEIEVSLTNLKKMDDDILVLSGHGRQTTIGEEKQYDSYFY